MEDSMIDSPDYDGDFDPYEDEGDEVACGACGARLSQVCEEHCKRVPHERGTRSGPDAVRSL